MSRTVVKTRSGLGMGWNRREIFSDNPLVVTFVRDYGCGVSFRNVDPMASDRREVLSDCRFLVEEVNDVSTVLDSYKGRRSFLL